jgi:hypothetical protein
MKHRSQILKLKLQICLILAPLIIKKYQVTMLPLFTFIGEPITHGNQIGSKPLYNLIWQSKSLKIIFVTFFI